MNLFEDGQARQYPCKKCGAVWLTDDRSAVESCYFCGSPVFLGGRLTGSVAPDRILPFAIPEKQAKQAFRRWRLRLKLAPKEYEKESRNRQLQGVYLPFYLYDDDASANTGHGKQALVCASHKLNSRLTDALFPFDLSQLQRFDGICLSGNAAERADRTAAEFLPTNQAQRASYVLLPVWLVCCDESNEDYIFAMNGQTGALANNPPCSVTKTLSAAGLLTIFFFLIFRLVTVCLGGGFI